MNFSAKKNPARHKERQIRLRQMHFHQIFFLAVAFGLACIPSQARAQRGQQNRNTAASSEDAQLAAEAQEAMRHGDFLRAIPALEKLAKDAPGIAEIHANLGTAYYSVGRYEDAARQDQEALKLKPSLINAHFFLGLSLAEGGRCE